MLIDVCWPQSRVCGDDCSYRSTDRKTTRSRRVIIEILGRETARKNGYNLSEVMSQAS